MSIEVVRHLPALHELSLYGFRVHNLARLRRGVAVIRVMVRCGAVRCAGVGRWEVMDAAGAAPLVLLLISLLR